MNPCIALNRYGRMAALLVAGAFASGSAGAQQFTMKLSSPTANDLQIEWMNTFKKGVEARAGGKMKIDIYPANQLGPIPRTVEGVALGTIEVTMVASGFLVGLEPRFNAFDAIGLFDSMEHGMKVLGDPEIRKRLTTFGSAKGVEILTAIMHSPNGLVSKKAVITVADVKGLKIRVPGSPLQVEPLKRLGASPLSMPLGEVLPALQNGTIDGAVAGNTIFTAFKYYDVAKNITYLPSSFIVGTAIVNRNFMNSLGPQLAAIVREEARKADAIVTTWGVEDVAKSRKTWEQNGGQNHVLAPPEAKRFLDEVAAASTSVLAGNAQTKADYDALLAASKKYRQ
jgi:TRAP-type C4-dicarboxylate transport system substrate-binding protein